MDIPALDYNAMVCSAKTDALSLKQSQHIHTEL